MVVIGGVSDDESPKSGGKEVFVVSGGRRDVVIAGGGQYLAWSNKEKIVN